MIWNWRNQSQSIPINMKTDQAVIDDIRIFNRYYTKLLGLLDNRLLDSQYSLLEARILFEIHASGEISASQILSEIDIDKGYLSKVLKQFEKKGLILKQLSEADGRVTLLSLTAVGKKTYAKLNSASNTQVESLISKLSNYDQQKLADHMQAIMKLLSLNDANKQTENY